MSGERENGERETVSSEREYCAGGIFIFDLLLRLPLTAQDEKRSFPPPP